MIYKGKHCSSVHFSVVSTNTKHWHARYNLLCLQSLSLGSDAMINYFLMTG